MEIKSFRDLQVWQKSIDLVQEVYNITSHLPSNETFGLSSQIQRASISIPSNIAEGSKRKGRADFRKFCMVAQGSAAELETQLAIIGRLYPNIPLEKAIYQLTEIQKMLSGLTNKLRTNNKELRTI